MCNEQTARAVIMQSVVGNASMSWLWWENGNAGREGAVVYQAKDIPKRMVLSPIVNGTKSNTSTLSCGTMGYSCRRNFSWVCFT
jgi:hypothetical protein